MKRSFFHGAIGIAAAAAILGGCSARNRPITVSVSQMRPYPTAAKGDGCGIPVLNDMPKGHVEELAIVEGWAGSPQQESELMEKLKNQGCQIGADALLIVTSKSQLASHKNTIVMANEIAESADTNADSTLDVMHNSYIAAAQNHGGEGTRGHGGFYVETYALKYASDPGKQ